MFVAYCEQQIELLGTYCFAIGTNSSHIFAKPLKFDTHHIPTLGISTKVCSTCLVEFIAKGTASQLLDLLPRVAEPEQGTAGHFL